MFTLKLDIAVRHQYVSSIKMSLDAAVDFLEIINDPRRSLLPLTEYLSHQEYQFLCYWRTLKKEQKKTYTLMHPPFSAEFTQFLGVIPTQFQINEETFNPKFTNKPYTPKLSLNITESEITFKSQQQLLLFTGTHPLVFHKDSLFKLDLPFSETTINKLFAENKAPLTLEETIFLTNSLKQKKSYFHSMISFPKIVESEHITPVFEFGHKDNKYEISLFLEAQLESKVEQFILNPEQIRQHLKDNLPFTMAGRDGSVLMISTDHPVREKIDAIIKTGFKNFYTVLGEIQGNKIITNDRNNLFENFLPQISDDVIIYNNTRKKRMRFILASGSPSVGIKSISKTPLFGNMDWLSVDFEFDHQSIKLSLKDLSEIIQHGFLEKNNMLIALPQESTDPLKKLLELSRNKNQENVEIHATFLPWLLSLYPKADIPKEWNELKEFIQENKLPEITLPSSMDTVLRDYQKTGIKRLSLLHRFGFGTVLADEMGLGKTLQILTLLDIHCHEGKILIVTPSALTLNWYAEIEKFYPNRFKTLIVTGNKDIRKKNLKNIDDYDIIITSYHTLGSDEALYTDYEFQFLIIDEAQHIKNKNAKRSKSVKKINARSRIAVSGTPLENNISELWSIFDFIMPDFLGSHKNFQKNFEEPLQKFDMEKRKQILQQLHQMTIPFIIRRTKATTYKELPPKIEQTIITELTTKQKTLYLETLSDVRSNFLNIVEKRGFNQSRIDFLSTLTKLRQIALHPALVYPELRKEDSETISAKIPILSELLLEAFDSGHRVLIFSQFVSMLELIKPELQKHDIEFLYIDGKTPNRVELAEKFNNGEVPVFLISLKAGGIGLNLTGADTVILFDPWWNPSVENQAIDRAHRIGQSKTVNVYRLMTKGTIEEKIYNLQRRKEFLFEKIMQENPNFDTFSAEELLSLLNIDEEPS